MRLIRFDWAMKTILRDKANFDILEGFLSALLNDDEIKILSILESEGNQILETDKFNRVDLLVQDSLNRKIIIEIQNSRETDYLKRILYGTSKIIVENQKLGDSFVNVAKVISISILYFNLGYGNDYLYSGTTEFRGMNLDEKLVIRERVKSDEDSDRKFKLVETNIFPEYYLINVERYKNIVSKHIDEWIYLMKNNEVLENFSSKNINKARQKLAVLNMSDEERKIYERYVTDEVIDKAQILAIKEVAEIFNEGKNEGKIEGKIETAQNLKKLNVPVSTISEATGLSQEEIEKII